MNNSKLNLLYYWFAILLIFGVFSRCGRTEANEGDMEFESVIDQMIEDEVPREAQITEYMDRVKKRHEKEKAVLATCHLKQRIFLLRSKNRCDT